MAKLAAKTTRLSLLWFCFLYSSQPMHQPHTMLVLTKIIINLALQVIILIHSKYFFASDWFTVKLPKLQAPQISVECECIVRKKPVRCEKTKPQTVISLGGG